MKLVVTIDTEEDNWGQYNLSVYSLDNIEKIPKLQALFDQFGVPPTYLLTYPVATDEKSVRILRRILDDGKCEIGMHCHPWNTPPFEETRNDRNSMLCNLPADLQHRKMSTLHEVIARNFGIEPKSSRAGRWGYSETVAAVLGELNYSVDTSVTPFTDWSEYFGPDFSAMGPEPYRVPSKGVTVHSVKRNLIEIPATIGYLQDNFRLCSYIDQRLKSKWSKRLHMKGVLSRVGLLNKIHLSPESVDSPRMIQLTKVFLKKESEIINMFFHSTSLKSGLGSFVETVPNEPEFLSRLRRFLTFTREVGIKGITLSEGAIGLSQWLTASYKVRGPHSVHGPISHNQ